MQNLFPTFLRIADNLHNEKYWCKHCFKYLPKSTYYNHREKFKFDCITHDDVEQAKMNILEGYFFGIQFKMNL